ncbi:hypothetical protein B4U80_14096 [Leptotrombidium deliense]|uniref:Uncharacterized protein n=1 Tax=Leptotrombidium deliense TaxID=299467 RepID=A0A443S2W7_9ACAR|nr:hypothetical protein B4U80_14096 [Leptotrombidium deliense]
MCNGKCECISVSTNFRNETPFSWRVLFTNAIWIVLILFVEEAKVSNNLTLDDYLAFRPIIVAFQLPQLLIEYAKDDYLSGVLRDIVAIKSIQMKANFVAMILQDLFSFSSEAKNESNFISVHMKHEKMTEEAAILKAIEYFEEKIQLYLKNREIKTLNSNSTEWYWKSVDQLIRRLFDLYETIPRLKS